MDFSVWPSSGRSWPEVLETAVAADRDGWHGVWFADHFMPNVEGTAAADDPVLEVWSVLAGLAAATERVRLGSLVTSVTYRHPAVLAKIASTTDRISAGPTTAGRVVLGIGAGWQINEHEAYGLTLGDVPTRSDRLEEAAVILRSLLNEHRTTVAGEFFTVTDAPNEPKSMQSPLPLLVAGKGEHRTLRTAARHADEWNGWCRPDEMAAKRAVLERHCEAAGRNPAAIRCSTQAFVCFTDGGPAPDEFLTATTGRPTLVGSTQQIVDQVAAHAEAGADELILPEWLWDDRAERADQLARFRSEVLTHFID